MRRSVYIIGTVLLALTFALTACGEDWVRRRATATASPAPIASPIFKRAPTPRPTATAVTETSCPLPDLQVSQHITAGASYTETETSAAGPMVCRIERDSCPYYHMIGNLGPTIVFKKEEEPPYNAEDILMHPTMLLPLTRLDALVQNEWGGLYWLCITGAYDSLLEHDLTQIDESRKYSLHFEGRSVDLTTWPIDPARYGRLCALAHCAGFDWVHHEGDHCHASIKAESLCLRCN